MTINQLTQQIHEDVCHLRNIYNAITSYEFVSAWNKAQEREREQIQQIIKDKDMKELRAWTRRILNTDLWAMPVRELRARASRKKIRGYNRMTKVSLIKELELCNK